MNSTGPGGSFSSSRVAVKVECDDWTRTLEHDNMQSNEKYLKILKYKA